MSTNLGETSTNHTQSAQNPDNNTAGEGKQDYSNKYIAGLDLGGTSVKLGLLTPAGKTVSQQVCPLASRDFEYVVETMVAGIKQLLASCDADLDSLCGVGICAPGLVDADAGTVIQAANFPKWQHVPICQAVARSTKCPVFIENDASAAAIGEWWRASQGLDRPLNNVCLLTLGTGVGGGFIVDGHILKGMGMAGEIGHTIVDFSDTAKACGCGQAGCLELYTSANGIVNYAKECVDAGREPSSALVEAVQNGSLSCADVFSFAFPAKGEADSLALHVVTRTSRLLAQSILNLVRLLDTEHIVIGGGVSDAGQPFIDAIDQELKRLWWRIPRKHTLRITQAQLGNAAGYVGAAKVVLDKLSLTK